MKYIWRETYLSALDMSRESLEVLGFSKEFARKSVRMFRDYDDELIEQQQAMYDDEAKLIASAQSATAELESLFENDLNEAKALMAKKDDQ